MDEIQKALKDRYPLVHPLMFHRSLERAKTHGELFDIMESIPENFPLIWNEKERIWETTDLLQSEKFNERKNRVEKK